jgi:hypothetical protein
MGGAAGARFQAGGDYLVARQTLAAQRRAGASFDEAWALALKMVNRDDRGVLKETKGAWHRAYLREPFYSAGAFGKLAAVTVTDGDAETRQAQVVR